MIPGGDQRESQYEGFSIDSDPLLNTRMNQSSYGGFHEDNDPYYLGVAKEESRIGFMNKLFFKWVNPLIKKAGKGRLQHPDDVFDLPEQLTPHSVSLQVRRQWESLEKQSPLHHHHDSHQVPRISLLRLLFNCYGREFFMIGSLKFLADCAGFAGPILLNCVVSFMEDNDSVSEASGYFYAVLLALSSFVGALCSCHFNLLMTELGLKVRSALVTAVYDKVRQVEIVLVLISNIFRR